MRLGVAILAILIGGMSSIVIGDGWGGGAWSRRGSVTDTFKVFGIPNGARSWCGGKHNFTVQTTGTKVLHIVGPGTLTEMIYTAGRRDDDRKGTADSTVHLCEIKIQIDGETRTISTVGGANGIPVQDFFGWAEACTTGEGRYSLKTRSERSDSSCIVTFILRDMAIFFRDSIDITLYANANVTGGLKPNVWFTARGQWIGRRQIPIYEYWCYYAVDTLGSRDYSKVFDFRGDGVILGHHLGIDGTYDAPLYRADTTNIGDHSGNKLLESMFAEYNNGVSGPWRGSLNGDHDADTLTIHLSESLSGWSVSSDYGMEFSAIVSTYPADTNRNTAMTRNLSLDASDSTISTTTDETVGDFADGDSVIFFAVDSSWTAGDFLYYAGVEEFFRMGYYGGPGTWDLEGWPKCPTYGPAADDFNLNFQNTEPHSLYKWYDPPVPMRNRYQLYYVQNYTPAGGANGDAPEWYMRLRFTTHCLVFPGGRWPVEPMVRWYEVGSGTMDKRLRDKDATWAAARAGTGLGAYDVESIQISSNYTGGVPADYDISRAGIAIYCPDVDSGSVTAAQIDIVYYAAGAGQQCTADTCSLAVYLWEFADPTDLVAGDYDGWHSAYSDAIGAHALTDLSNNTAFSTTVPAGALPYIVTGNHYCEVAVLSHHDHRNVAPTIDGSNDFLVYIWAEDHATYAPPRVKVSYTKDYLK